MKVVQARLGHACAAETLDTYSHLWPDSEDRTREAVDAVLETARPTVGPDPRFRRSGPVGQRVGLYAGDHEGP